ncbi:13225_t:CDS:2, partial [Entrophospora sp. SA101]
TYTRFNEERDALLEKSKMFGIPMGIRYGFMAFEQSSLSVSANEPLDPQEAKWISDIMRGGLILAKNEWKGYGGQYDFTNVVDQGDDDDNIANEELEGVLEAIGMRGSPWVLVQNSALMALLISICLACSVWIPYTIGKTFLLVKNDF